MPDYVLRRRPIRRRELSLFTMHFPRNHCQLRGPVMPPLEGTKPEAEIYAEIIDRLGVVDRRTLDELRSAAALGDEAFALAFFGSVHADPRLGGLAPYLLYRTLGETLGKAEAVAMLWAMAQLAAISQPKAVAAAGHAAAALRWGRVFSRPFGRDERGLSSPSTNTKTPGTTSSTRTADSISSSRNFSTSLPTWTRTGTLTPVPNSRWCCRPVSADLSPPM